MMLTTTEDLEARIGSKYVLVLLVAKRARQLREGAPKLVQTNSTNPISIALQEIQEGKLGVVLNSIGEVSPETGKFPGESGGRYVPPIPIDVDAAEIEMVHDEDDEADDEHEEEAIGNIMAPTGEEDETEEDESEDEDSDDDDSLDGLEAGEVVEE